MTFPSDTIRRPGLRRTCKASQTVPAPRTDGILTIMSGLCRQGKALLQKVRACGGRAGTRLAAKRGGTYGNDRARCRSPPCSRCLVSHPRRLCSEGRGPESERGPLIVS